MVLPRPDQVRRELMDIGATYLTVLAVLLVGALIVGLASATGIGAVSPAPVEPAGPFF